MADVIYNSFKVQIGNGGIDFDTDDIKGALVTSGYTPDQDSHDFFDDITNEVVGAGYSAGGMSLTTKTVTQDNTDNEGVYSADNLTWTSSTITARGLVLYKDTGTPATSPLICYFDFVSDKTSSSSDFTVQWAAEGILNLT